MDDRQKLLARLFRWREKTAVLAVGAGSLSYFVWRVRLRSQERTAVEPPQLRVPPPRRKTASRKMRQQSCSLKWRRPRGSLLHVQSHPRFGDWILKPSPQVINLQADQ